MESAPFLHQLIRYHPDHVKGLILLGDLYVNQLRDLASAEKCYHRILEVDPDNIHGTQAAFAGLGQVLEGGPWTPSETAWWSTPHLAASVQGCETGS